MCSFSDFGEMGTAFLKEPKTEKTTEDGENKFVKYGISSMQGWRMEMEDAHVVRLCSDKNGDGINFFGVFDGHCGEEVALYCSLNLIPCVMAQEEYPDNLPAALKKSFFAMDENLLDPEKSAELLRDRVSKLRRKTRKQVRCEERDSLEREVRARMDDANAKGSLSSEEALSLAEIFSELEEQQQASKRIAAGCTAICATLQGRKLVVANAGDSRAVLCRKGGIAEAMSFDHKPDNLIERERICKSGGFVAQNRVNGQLAMSRAIGDFDFKQNDTLPASEQAVTCDPDIREVELEEGDEFIILACDGIWDAISNEGAVRFIRNALRTEQKISTVVSKLLDRCLAETTSDMSLSTDNMTCIVVVFKPDLFAS